jgi:hypothetical protein
MPEAILVAAIATAVLAYLLLRRSGGGQLDSYYDPSDGERQPHKWGYTDTRFEFDGPRSVLVTGSRYPLCGQSLPKFIPFAEEVLGVPITPEEMMPEVERGALPPPRPSSRGAGNSWQRTRSPATTRPGWCTATAS